MVIIEDVREKNLVEKAKDSRIIDQKFSVIDIPYNWIEIIETNTRNPERVKRDYKFLPMKLSKYIRENLHYFFVNSIDTEKIMIYVYMNGVYKLVNDAQFKGFIKEFIPQDLRTSRGINEVYNDLVTDFKFVDYNLLDNDENIINFQDGILELDSMELKPHTPEIYSTIQIPANYRDIENSTEEAPVFKKYMYNLVDNDVDTYIMLMQIVGLIISNIACSKTKKSLLLCGKGDTGKSQLKRLVEELIGEQNVCVSDLKQLNERFGTAALYKKRLAGSNDMSFQRITDMSIFKQVTGGDKITLEIKHKGTFPYQYKGFLWFNCNKLPMFGGDDGKWVYDRMLIVYCKNVIPDDKKDPHLFDKMWLERNAIIKEALFFLKKLIDDKFKFVIPEKMAKVKKEYETENNTLLSFIEECCYVNDDIMASSRIKKTDFRKGYYKWCDLNGMSKGKLKPKEIDEILIERFGAEFIKTDGYFKIKNIMITKEAQEDLYLDLYGG